MPETIRLIGGPLGGINFSCLPEGTWLVLHNEIAVQIVVFDDECRPGTYRRTARGFEFEGWR